MNELTEQFRQLHWGYDRTKTKDKDELTVYLPTGKPVTVKRFKDEATKTIQYELTMEVSKDVKAVKTVPRSQVIDELKKLVK